MKWYHDEPKLALGSSNLTRAVKFSIIIVLKISSNMLTIYDKEDFTTYTNYEEIARQLDNINVLYVQVSSIENIIEQIKYDYDVPYNDTIVLDSSTENYQSLREQFNKEHYHTDYEMRLFTNGTAKFFFNVSDTVYELDVGPNDLISVPANVKHWFDAGEYPNIKAVRFFTEKDGWEANYT
jgi:1,2-dihydroxy-3-keto-5-methylthiopentene dioxygenase